ncbi:MAG: hypothetical protein ACJATF_004445, partial [Flavobacteriales bacterium]
SVFYFGQNKNKNKNKTNWNGTKSATFFQTKAD